MPYQPDNTYGRLYESESGLQLAVGLVRSAMSRLTRQELALDEYYKLIDEKRNMQELPRPVDQPPAK